MMNVKKYRAATTREALEQIKQELGEDAFVLETKQVKSGGFFGLRSEMQIEISAAAPKSVNQPIAETAAKPAKAASSVSYNSILNLTDDALAMPEQFDAETDDKKNTLLNALNVRAASARDYETAVANFQPAPELSVDEFKPEIDSVEITTDAPRLVHQKKEIAKAVSAERNFSSVNVSENYSPTIQNRELDLLRAELREIKFSLGNFTNRQNAPVWQSGNSGHHFQVEHLTGTSDEFFNQPFYEAYFSLTGTGVSSELAQKLLRDVVEQVKEGLIERQQISKAALLQGISSMVRFEADPLHTSDQTILAFVGATGVGKTTTIAKLAARVALHEQRRVELVTIDTYRIAAVEQLKTYAEIIGAGCHVVRSVFELDAILHRLPSDATVLIDTTGRNPHDLADQHELSDYLRRRQEIRKCLAMQAIINPIDGLAAIKKFEMYGVDCLAFTKLDETSRPGALLELAAGSSVPLAYLCMGQRVPEDLNAATVENFAAHITRENV